MQGGMKKIAIFTRFISEMRQDRAIYYESRIGNRTQALLSNGTSFNDFE